MTRFGRLSFVLATAALIQFCWVEKVNAAGVGISNPVGPTSAKAGATVEITVTATHSAPPQGSDPDAGMADPYLIDQANMPVFGGEGTLGDGDYNPVTRTAAPKCIFKIPLGAAVGDKFRAKVGFLSLDGMTQYSVTSPEITVIP